LHTSLGHWTISGKEGNLALGIAVASGTNPEEALFSLTDDGSRLIGDTQLARQQPSLLRAVRTYADNLYHEQGPLVEVLPLPLLALAFLGLIHEPLNREQRLGRFVIVTFIMLYLLVYPLLFVFARLLVPLVGLVIPSLACGTQDLQSRCSPTLKYASRPHGFRYRVRSVVARHYLEIGVVFVLVILGIGYQSQALAEPKFHSVVSAGRWFVEHGESSAVVMATHGSGISYYGRLDQYALMTPYAEYPRLLDYAYLRNVEYLVVEERLIGLRPMQRSLLNWGQHPAELVPVYVDESERDHAVVIYRVSRESASRMHAQAAGQGQARP
jgi:hypothetical protein